VAVAAGDYHVVALRADGRVLAWGSQNDFGEINVPPDVTNAVRIAAGSAHSLALLDDGTVRFWGSFYATGVTNPPLSAVSNMVLLAQGPSAQHVLSVRSDGTAVDWGNSQYGLPNVPLKATNIIGAAVASFDSLVLRADGTPVTWGDYFPGGTAVVPANASNVVAVAAAMDYDLALRADGTLLAWGDNAVDAIIPAGATNITAIAAGGGGLLALRADGRLFSWFPYPSGQTNAIPAWVSNVVAIAASTDDDTLAIMASDGPPLLGRMPRHPVAVGTVARFAPLVISTTPVSYQWMLAGTNLPGATCGMLVLTNVNPDQAGTYSLIASNAFGAVTNSDLTLTVLPLIIQAAPQSQTVAAGATATFNVTAFGKDPLSYHWQFNGTNLPGATTNSLALKNVQLNQAGAYAVVVSNALGMVTSQSAILGVVPLFITPQPQSQSTYVGGPASFSVATSGTGPYSYQWQLYGTNLPSGTNSSLSLTNVQFSGSGPYTVVVSNAFGAVTSSSATLSVLPILVTSEPLSQAAFLGQTVTFSATALADLPLDCQWQFNGADLPGATGRALTLTNCQYGQSGIYQLVMTDSAAVTNSSPATLAVDQVTSWGQEGQANVPAGLSNVVAVAGGGAHSLALKTDGSLVRWGDSTNVPSGLSNVVAIAAGGAHDLALCADGSIVAWGDNSYGQLDVPSELTNPISVAAGNYHSAALLADGTVLAWGGNSNGQTNVPPGLTGVVAIAAGANAFHTLALKADGTVAAWGDNEDGESTVPPGLSNVVALAGGDGFSLALTSGGGVAAWGFTGNGITSVPASATNVVAIAAGYGHGVALKSDGTVLAWGYGLDGETAVPGDLENAIGIGAGSFFCLAIVMEGSSGPKAALANPAWNVGRFTVSLPTQSGKVYRLEYKNSLTDTNWSAMPLAAGTGGVITLADPTANGSDQRFYRVRQW
jgi:alpha-tubulin suppressor-like RCC1 family protein/predicted aconitase with swiveling domain